MWPFFNIHIAELPHVANNVGWHATISHIKDDKEYVKHLESSPVEKELL
jgi:hypothetical protein